jgi:hypothetical protein
MNVVPLEAVHFRDLFIQFPTTDVTKMASELGDRNDSNAINVDFIHFMWICITYKDNRVDTQP